MTEPISIIFCRLQHRFILNTSTCLLFGPPNSGPAVTSPAFSVARSIVAKRCQQPSDDRRLSITPPPTPSVQHDDDSV